ncbi:MAG: DNA oxidative demethylase AlkB [Panacagrimonas sp.]
MQAELFAGDAGLPRSWTESLAPGAVVLRGYALRTEAVVLADLRRIVRESPMQHMQTPGGHRMSVATTSCGLLGWVSDRSGYRYDALDPASGKPWPAMPASFSLLASQAAGEAGFAGAFTPDSCLINRYCPGARLSLHQDRNERDFGQPIVSVSFGIRATFLFGGERRSDPAQRVILEHGDVAVWGGPSRLRFHGVLPLKPGAHPVMGEQRINLTFRKAG